MSLDKHLEKLQKGLKLNVIDYDLDKMWCSHELVGSLREKIVQFFPTGLYDPQDLEHQVLFRLTTFDPKDINDEIIKAVVEEQYSIIEDRLSKISYDREYLFRGLSGKYHDLNCKNRLMLHKESDGRLIAKNDNHSFTVEFRAIKDEGIISLFTNELHYIHDSKTKGETFGLFFAGDEIPWAIETTEPSVIAKQYKRDALVAHGIDPNKAIELTRLYTLPGSPRNAVSVMDSMVMKYYKTKDIEAVYSTTMPMYSKTKGTTVASNMDDVMLVKKLVHKFIPVNINGKNCYRQVTSTYLANKNITDYLITHPNFPTMLTVEVFTKINRTNLEPISILKDKKKVIYVMNQAYMSNRKQAVEKELKVFVTDINATLSAIRKIAKFSHVEYIKDSMYNFGDQKIRVRVADNFNGKLINAMYKYRIASDQGLKTEIEETVYEGGSLEDALAAIMKIGPFKEANSYEKIRTVYLTDDVSITLDIYPYGTWLEVEGEPNKVWDVAKQLSYSKDDSIIKNADELYDEWCRKYGLDILWDVRFGLHNPSNRIYEKAADRKLKEQN